MVILVLALVEFAVVSATVELSLSLLGFCFIPDEVLKPTAVLGSVWKFVLLISYLRGELAFFFSLEEDCKKLADSFLIYTFLFC